MEKESKNDQQEEEREREDRENDRKCPEFGIISRWNEMKSLYYETELADVNADSLSAEASSPEDL